MEKRTIIEVENAFYFATYRIRKYTALFSTAAFVDIILNALAWLKAKERMYLVAFVIMPTHIHFIYKPKDRFSATQVAHSFGSFTAHEIMKMIRERFNEYLPVFQPEYESHAQVWEDRFIKTITTEYHLKQKIEYIHNNPVRKGWELVQERGVYQYSSACYYDYGKAPVIPVDNFGDIE